MKNKLVKKVAGIVIVVALAFSFAPVYAETDTTQALLDQIQALVAQLNDLQQQVNALLGQQQELQQEIIELRRTLARGISGDDVEDLQELLASDPDLYPEGLVTGYFGPLTEAAVKRLQERFGIDQVGIVGPITRGTVNKLFRNLNRGQGSLNKGKGNLFDRIFADDDELDDDDIDLSEFIPGTKGVFVCHAPPGNPAKMHTIAIGGPAVQAHIRHGDTLGRCGDEVDDDDGDETAEEKAQSAIDDAKDAIDDAQEAIDDAKDDGRDTDSAEELLADAQTKLDEAEEEFDDENFGNAEDLADEAKELAEDAEDAIGEVADETAPVISDVTSTDVASTTATITWDTDEDANSKVSYSTDSAVESDVETESNSTLTMSHSLDLFALATSTEYFYFVESKDDAGNTATSSISSFTTLE